MSAFRIAYAGVLAALAGALATWGALGIYSILYDLQRGRSPVPDPVEIVRALAMIVVIGVPAALPLTVGAAVAALWLRRRGFDDRVTGPERYPMRTRFVLGCAAAGALWEAGVWILVAGAMRARLIGVGGACGFVAGAAGGWVLWRWSQRSRVVLSPAVPATYPR